MFKKLLLLGLCCFSIYLMGSEEEGDSFPFSLVEVAPQVSFLSQTWPINNLPTAFNSSPNPGGVIRFIPIWRKKFPIFIHFGVTRLIEENTAGVTVNGEHQNLKYIWTFGARFGFRVLPRWILSTGLEFDHEPFLFDTGGQTAFLNKVLVPTAVLMSSLEWWRTENVSMLLDLGIKGYLTVPMDLYMFRNGLVLHAKAGARWNLGQTFALTTSAYIERRGISASTGDIAMFNFGLEVGIGWGDGK